MEYLDLKELTFKEKKSHNTEYFELCVNFMGWCWIKF